MRTLLLFSVLMIALTSGVQARTSFYFWTTAGDPSPRDMSYCNQNASAAVGSVTSYVESFQAGLAMLYQGSGDDISVDLWCMPVGKGMYVALSVRSNSRDAYGALSAVANAFWKTGAGGSSPIADRINALRPKLSVDDYARLYADLSVLIAGYGAQVGWPNGPDTTAPSDDTGRGVTDWEAHHQHGVVYPGGLANLVGGRMMALQAALNADAYSQLAARVSEKIEQFGG